MAKMKDTVNFTVQSEKEEGDEEGGMQLNCIPAELTGRQGGPPTTYLYCTRVRRPQKKGKAIYLKSRLKTKKGEAKEPNLDEPPPPSSQARVTKLLLFCLLLLFCVKISN